MRPVGQVRQPVMSQVAQVVGQFWQIVPLWNVPDWQELQARGDGLQIRQLVSKARQDTAVSVGPYKAKLGSEAVLGTQ